MASSKTRLLKELKSCTQQSHKDIGVLELLPDERNMYEWIAILEGPAETPYHGGRFRVKFVVPPTYPMAPPQASFLTTIFHPNVHFKTGEICLDILKNAWSPAWTLLSVCQAIVALLHEPAADSPLNCDAGNLLRADDMRAYNGLARMYTIEYAGMRS